jgi:uncharacterized protein (TIGR02118 family)
MHHGCMLKRVTVLQCGEGVDRGEALSRWLQGHRALVRAVPGVVEYVQRPATTDAEFSSTATLLGIGEVSFASRADAVAATATPEWQAVIDDAATFASLPPLAVCWLEE